MRDLRDALVELTRCELHLPLLKEWVYDPSRKREELPMAQKHFITDAFKFSGSKVAFNGPVDRFVVMLGPRTAVITNVGDVFGHDNFDFVDILVP